MSPARRWTHREPLVPENSRMGKCSPGGTQPENRPELDKQARSSSAASKSFLSPYGVLPLTQLDILDALNSIELANQSQGRVLAAQADAVRQLDGCPLARG